MQFYTVADLKEMLKLSASQIYALIDAGKMRCHRFTTKKNGAVRVSQAQLDDYLRETASEGETSPPPKQAAADKTSTAGFTLLDGKRLREAWEGRR